MTFELKVYSRILVKDLEELFGMNEVLREDMSVLLDALDEDPENQTLRRSFVRASWAFVEAMVFGIKAMTLRAMDLGQGDMTWKDRKFLTEESFAVSIDGVVKRKSEYPGAVPNIKCAFQAASKYFELDWKPSFMDVRWQKVPSAIELRNRLMHPKSVRTVHISDEEIQGHRSAIEWFLESYKGMFNGLLAKHAPEDR